MKTIVALEGAEFFAFHGYYAIEQKIGHTFVIDVQVELASFDSLDDDINDTVNYEELYQICKVEMERTQKLLETVVLNILNAIQQKYPHIVDACVRMKKIGPQLGGKVEKAVITMSL